MFNLTNKRYEMTKDDILLIERKVEGKTYEEISELMGIPAATVRTRAADLMNKLGVENECQFGYQWGLHKARQEFGKS